MDQGDGSGGGARSERDSDSGGPIRRSDRELSATARPVQGGARRGSSHAGRGKTRRPAADGATGPGTEGPDQRRKTDAGGSELGDRTGRQRVGGSPRTSRQGEAAGGRSGAGQQADRRPRPAEPALPQDVDAGDLDRTVRGRLRGLTKENADRVARHLVCAGRMMDLDPELAYEHAQAAVRRAGRVDVVREAAGLTAYQTGRYAEALRELRTVRRLSGMDAHRAVEADCERGLGRPERALALAAAPEVAALPAADQVEIALVASGARLDLGEADAALLALDAPVVRAVREPELRARAAQARAAVLEALGRAGEAEEERRSASLSVETEPPVVVVDLEESAPEPERESLVRRDAAVVGRRAGRGGPGTASATAGEETTDE